MPPTEEKILTSYLLAPAQLPSIISLAEFAALFPRSLQSSPHIRSLYRDLQARRNALVDAIAQDISAQAARGRALRREVARQRREALAAEAQDFGDDEMEVERMLHGSTQKHILSSILPELQGAVDELEGSLQLLQDQENALLEQIRQTVGSMSDLRYGRLANAQLRDQVLEGLANLQETCKAKD